MTARLLAFAVWALVGGTALFWGLRLGAAAPKGPPHAVASTSVAGAGDLTRVLGADAPAVVDAPPAASSRFQLTGVVAPQGGRPEEGLALIAVDGQPPKTYRVGSVVDGELFLLGVHQRGAAIGPQGGPAQVNLDLPALPPPSTGSLPVATSNSAPAQQVAQAPNLPAPAPPPSAEPTIVEEQPSPAAAPEVVIPPAAPSVMRGHGGRGGGGMGRGGGGGGGPPQGGDLSR